jgi:hypothetical protein
MFWAMALGLALNQIRPDLGRLAARTEIVQIGPALAALSGLLTGMTRRG